MKTCKHMNLKVRKHKANYDPCLHCLTCPATWSDPGRAMWYLKTKKLLVAKNKYE